MTIASFIVSLIAALGLGGFLNQYLLAGKDRRTARSEVLAALSDVENARWAPSDQRQAASFRDALRRLSAAALVAKMPRDVVVHYLVLAQAAHWASIESRDQGEGEEWAGGIHTDFAHIVRDAAQLVAAAAWEPVRSRRHWARRSEQLRLRAEALDDAASVRALSNARSHGAI